MNQDITLNLIVLNQQGKPQFILEPRQQSPVGTVFPAQNDMASSFGETIPRQSQHVGGTTLSQIMEKEHMA
jgi:hypothetical protein